MKAVQIISHALRQVTANLPAAVRVSGVLYLAQFVVSALLGGAMLVGMGAGGGGMGFFPIVIFLVSLVTAVWIAVAWHRFVLLAENPTAVVPPLMQDRMMAYFLRSLGLAVVLIVTGAILGSVIGVLVGGMMMQGAGFLGFLLIALFVQVPLTFVGLRLASVLPGAALGTEHGFFAGWQATKDDWQTFLQLALILALAMWAINMIGLFVFGGFGFFAMIWQFITGWPIMMIGLSILTTLYGHYIEGRPLV